MFLLSDCHHHHHHQHHHHQHSGSGQPWLIFAKKSSVLASSMMAAGGLALGLNRWTRGALNFKDLEQTPCSTAYLSVTQKKAS